MEIYISLPHGAGYTLYFVRHTVLTEPCPSLQAHTWASLMKSAVRTRHATIIIPTPPRNNTALALKTMNLIKLLSFPMVVPSRVRVHGHPPPMMQPKICSKWPASALFVLRVYLRSSQSLLRLAGYTSTGDHEHPSMRLFSLSVNRPCPAGLLLSYCCLL